jgi:hypothetical protein
LFSKKKRFSNIFFAKKVLKKSFLQKKFFQTFFLHAVAIKRLELADSGFSKTPRTQGKTEGQHHVSSRGW